MRRFISGGEQYTTGKVSRRRLVAFGTATTEPGGIVERFLRIGRVSIALGWHR